MRSGVKFIIFYLAILGLIPTAFIFSKFIGDDAGDKVEFYGDNVQQWMNIKFSHKFHLKDVGADCVDCHNGALESEKASDFILPVEEKCFECHDREETSCALCHRDPDNPVTFDIPVRKINFSHKFHIETQNLRCQQCHTGVDKVEYATPENLPDMESCFKCHDNRVATFECEACHVEIITLLPSTHKVVDFKTVHKRFVRSGGVENNCAVCHRDDFCQQCHDGVNLIKVPSTGVDFYAPFTPQSSGKIGMVLQRVHDLNYRYVHAIDAKGKEKDCYVCHDRQTFCAGCHTPGGDITLNRFKPKWHSGSDFVTIGVGSGGGKHAKFARQDIEMCMSCHDTEGADPTCVLCHVDRIPGIGNDPKTHPRNYKKNEEGIWHTDDGAVCYVCHVNTGTAGVGFCGYCHGAIVD